MASVPLAIFLVFLGCGANVFFLEHLIKIDSSSGHLITCGQFFLISAKQLFQFDFKNGFKIPLSRHFLIVALFVSISVINNWAFSFAIPLTLHIVFRAGSLVTNCLLSRIILKKQFSSYKYASVFTITAGIIICTLQTASSKPPSSNFADDAPQLSFGLLVLSVALFLSSLIGIVQEKTRDQFGKHPLECLFLHHFLSLPMFWFLIGPIKSSIATYCASETLELFGHALPKAWLFFAGNLATQYICIRSIFVLTSECTSLTVTLVITLRKFFSLVISVIYFKTAWTSWNWIGTAFVFGGTLMYAEVFSEKKKEKTS